MSEIIANQVFIGLPWTLRKKYDAAVDYLKSRSPLSFIIVGRNDKQDAKDLFEGIKNKISSSSYGIFDASGGNANVSLEYGLAEAFDIPSALYLSTHKGAKKASKDSPIISDLAGKKRNHYKVEAGLKKLLIEFSSEHPFSIQFERMLKEKYGGIGPGKKRFRALALKVIHMLDGQPDVRRADVVSHLQADNLQYKKEEIEQMIRNLHKARLIVSKQGPHSRLRIG